MPTIKMPKSCKECKCIGHYTYGPYARDPHYCCELMWTLFEEDHRVNPEEVDEDCPLKGGIVVKED